MFGPRRFHRHVGVWVAAFAVVGVLGWWLAGPPRPGPAECPAVGLPPGPRTEPPTGLSPPDAIQPGVLAGWAACLGNTPMGDAGAVRADVDAAANGVRVLVESAHAQGLVEQEMQRLSIPAAAVRFEIGQVCGSVAHGLGDGDGAPAGTDCN